MINSQEYILCAAIWYKDIVPTVEHHCKPINIQSGIVLCGWRHGNIIAQMIMLRGLRTVTNGENAVGEHEQGFLTSKNRFVDRETAFNIAHEAEQVKGDWFRKELYSEDIY